MTATRIFRRFTQLLDVDVESPADGDVPTYDAGTEKWLNAQPTGGGGGGPSTDTLADVLGRGADANAIEITNAADPTTDQSVATKASAQAQADAAEAAAEAASQPLDADLTAIAGLASGTAGAIASDGAGWIKKTYAQFKTALGLTSADVGLGSVTNDVQLKASQLDTDGTLAANSDTRVASQKAVKTFAGTGDAASVATAEAYTDSSVAALAAVYQPLDSDLTAIAALTTTSFGRALLALADAAALRSAAGLGTAAVAATGDFDAAGAAAAAQAASQPLDSDLTAIAALTTTSFGRALLALADAAALRTAAGLGTAAVAATGDFDAAGAAAAAQAASQPVDSDLTAIAALTTTSFGRGLLALADAAALRTDAGLVIGTDVEAHDADLTTIAGLTPTNDDVLQRKAGAWANRTLAQLISDLAGLGTTFQPLDSDLTSIAALSTTSFGRGLLALADSAALRTTAGLGTAATSASSDFDAAGAAAAAQAASQPLDSDLTAIAALSTTSFGRGFLVLADAAAARTAIGVVIGTDVEAHDADLTSIAALDSSTSGAIASDGAGWIKKTYAQLKTALSLVASDVGLGNVTNDAQLKVSALDTDGTLAANSDTKVASQKATKTYADTRDAATLATGEAYTDSGLGALSSIYQPLDSDLTAIAALTTTSFGRAFLALADAAAARTAIGLGDQYPNTYLTVADETIGANTQVIYEDYLELASSFEMELASGASLVLGDFATPLPLPDQNTNIFVTVHDETVPSNSEVVFSDFYELSAPFTTEVASTGLLQVGTGPDIAALPPGYEIGYDQITANVVIAGTAQASPTTIITCAPHLFDGSPVIVTFYCSQIAFDTSALSDNLGIDLWEGSTDICELAFMRTAQITNQFYCAATLSLRFTPTAGLHSYLIRAFASSATGSPTIAAGSGTGGANAPAFVRFTKV